MHWSCCWSLLARPLVRIITSVPYLIDGNNLLYALKAAGLELGRAGLCSLLAMLTARSERVSVIFDGPAAPGPPDSHTGEIDVAYSYGRSADELITQRIAADTAPRRLSVVSTDRQIRRAARRRRCKIVRSEDFAKLLIRLAEAPPKAPPAEPPEKRRGLSPGEADKWLKEFGLEAPDNDQP
ncbi:MAG: NYN domain-containing protein [Phycisphaerae bacterium]|nr:NYN domain-containing protein [Phycisphaerae bacterium]